MYVECLTTCVGFADILAETVSYVRTNVDRWLIVSAPADKDTQDVCHRYNLECLLTTEFHRNGAAFDKAKAIDHGLSLLTWKDWVCHKDVDIVLPGHFRESLEDADLDTACIYGCDRFHIHGREQWERFKEKGFLDTWSRCAHHNICFPGGFEVGARWADIHQGYVPIGFFQLFHRDAVMYRGIRQKRYSPYGHNDASRTDVQFGLQWPRRQRILLPEIVVAHLESEKLPTGANWNGRRSRPFGKKEECPPPS